MSESPVTQAGLGELLASMREGSLTAGDLLAAHFERIAQDDRHGAHLAAIALINPRAAEEASRLDAEFARTGELTGPLHGIPLVVKDNIDMAGLPTSSGSTALAKSVARRDAEQITRLRRAGAVILGKAHLSEMSFEIRSRSSLGGDVRNPFAAGVTAGGSSGGTAAAIAAGFAAAGIGTDTGGSIRIPSAFNGLVGLRPTHGRLDMRGIAPLAPSTDTVGPVARTVEDVARLFAVMNGETVEPFTPRPLPGVRIGVIHPLFGRDSEIVAAMTEALSGLGAQGAVLEDLVSWPQDLLPIGRPHIVDWEFRPSFDAYLAEAFQPGTAPTSVSQLYDGPPPPHFGEAWLRRLAVDSLDQPVYREILAFHAALRAELEEIMRRRWIDVFCYPTSAVVPTSFDNPASGWAAELAACSGWPAITVPVGQAANGVPIALELLGPPLSEPLLLGLAGSLEAVLGRRYRPALAPLEP